MYDESYPRGHALCKANDFGDRFWVLTSGAVVFKDGDGTVVKRFSASEDITPAFGELALMNDRPRKFDIVAVTAVEVRILTRKDLRSCWQQNTGAEDAMKAAVLLKYASVLDCRGGDDIPGSELSKPLDSIATSPVPHTSSSERMSAGCSSDAHPSTLQGHSDILTVLQQTIDKLQIVEEKQQVITAQQEEMLVVINSKVLNTESSATPASVTEYFVRVNETINDDNASEWVEFEDPASGHKYYENSSTGEVSWTCPT
jgi:signal-transduction protein with cAMP-binding, CBS, and nucleotidyltransferase domain